MRKFVIPSLIVLLTAIAPLHTALCQEVVEYVPDSKTAIAVASAIIKARIGGEKYNALAKGHDLEVQLDRGVWTCFFYPSDTQTKSSSHNGITEVTVVAGGGLPVLKISKADSRVIAFYYSK